jgi:SAM-dependent methyltransferase
MERVVYQEMAELDDRHWWYRARRQIIADLIRREAQLPQKAEILEIGCGTGHNLAMLSGFGHVEGLELDEEARALSEKRLGRKVMSSPLPELAGVPDRHYDLIGAFDVIEHIDDDRAALASIAAKLKAGGTFMMTVPAHQWMWSAHDVVNHHKRRYSKRALRELIEGSPLRLKRIGYFNSLLFPLAVAERAVSKARGKEDASVKLPPAPLNMMLEKVFAAERYLVGRFPLPLGLSLFAVASAR